MQANSKQTWARRTAALIAILILPMLGIRAQQVETKQAATNATRMTFDSPTDAGAVPAKAAKNANAESQAENVRRNELLAIDACYAIADAEQLYSVSRGEYAQRIVSTHGKQDGLYWPVSAGQGPSPLGAVDEIPKSFLTSFSPDQPLVIDGYTLRILTAQGKNASGGAGSYLVNGKISGGFAVLAAPVTYAQTGIMTFMVGSDGVVYERNFGPDTVQIASSIHEFNPAADWQPSGMRVRSVQPSKPEPVNKFDVEILPSAPSSGYSGADE